MVIRGERNDICAIPEHFVWRRGWSRYEFHRQQRNQNWRYAQYDNVLRCYMPESGCAVTARLFRRITYLITGNSWIVPFGTAAAFSTYSIDSDITRIGIMIAMVLTYVVLTRINHNLYLICKGMK
jgi:hypothetical protein